MTKDGALSGKGTFENPYVYEWSSYNDDMTIAKFYGFKESLSTMNKNNGYNKPDKYYKYKVWKRGSSLFHYNPYDWSYVMDLLIELKYRGFKMTKLVNAALVKLDIDELNRAVLDMVNNANTLYDHNIKKLYLRESDIVTFVSNGVSYSAVVVKVKGKLYVEHNVVEDGEIEIVLLPIEDTGNKKLGLLRNIITKVVKNKY